jgi:hypothetical protein
LQYHSDDGDGRSDGYGGDEPEMDSRRIVKRQRLMQKIIFIE